MAVEVGSAIGYLDLDISGFLSGLQTANEKADSMTKNMATKIGSNIKGIGESISSAGDTLTKTVSLPLAGIGTAGLKVAMDFEKSMSSVRAITGATGDDFDSLKKEAVDLGASTSFSANEVAEAMTDMAKAGWSTQQIMDGMSGVLNAAAASGTDLATTATIVADAITGFGLSASDSTRVADLLTQAANAGTIDITDLGESFKFISPVASSMGYSIEDVTTAISAMSMAGIKGSMAGTSLRGMLTKMVKPTDDVAKAMDELQISLTNQDGSFKPLNQSLAEMRTKFAGMTDEQKSYYAATLAGQEGMSGLLSLMNLTQDQYDAIADSMNNASGVAEQTATVMQDNLSSKVEQLGGSLETLAIKLGDVVIPIFQTFVGHLSDMVDKFISLNTQQQTNILKFAALAIAAGPVLKVFGTMTSGIGSMITVCGKIPGAFGLVSGGVKSAGTAMMAFKDSMALANAGFPALAAQSSGLYSAFAALAGPIGIVIAVIAVLVGAFVTLWNTNQTFKDGILNIWNQITTTFQTFTQGIVDRINALGFNFTSITDVIAAVWIAFCNLLAPVFTGAFQYISDTFTEITSIITGILDIFIGLFTGNWQQMWTGVQEVFGAVWTFIVSTFTNITNVLVGILNWFCGLFGTSWNAVWSSISSFFVGIWNGIVSFTTGVVNGLVAYFTTNFGNLSSSINQIFGGIYTIMTTIWNTIVTVVEGIIKLFSDTIHGNFDAVRTDISTIFGAIASAITTIWNGIKDVITGVVSFVVKFIGDNLTVAKNTVTTIFKDILKFISDSFDNALNLVKSVTKFAIDTFTNTLNGIWKAFFDMLPKVVDLVKSNFDAVTTFLTSLPSNMTKLGSAVIGGLTDGMSSVAGAIGDVVKDAFNTAIGFITSLPGQAVQWGKDFIQGLIDGIKSMVTDVADTVSGVADKIKSFLHFSVPDEGPLTTYMKWMPDMIAGLTKSFKDASPVLLEQVKAMTSEVSGTFTNMKDTIGGAVTDGFDYIVNINDNNTKSKTVDKDNKDNPTGGNSDTYNFYSPKAISEVEAARQMKKAKTELAEGF